MGSTKVLAQRLDTSFAVVTSIPFHGEPASIPGLFGGVHLIYAYTLRRKRDRFTPAMLRGYCLALGIDVFDTSFFSGPACLIERTRI